MKKIFAILLVNLLLVDTPSEAWNKLSTNNLGNVPDVEKEDCRLHSGISNFFNKSALREKERNVDVY
jgi:hypothetical protein